jgi:hypothetical protein
MAPLNKLFTNILIFGVCMNIVLYLFGAFNVDPQIQYPGSLSTMTSWFNLTPFNLLFTGATAAVIGISALLLRQGQYAIYAMLLTALGMILAPVQAFILAIPNALSMWLPASTNPNPALFPINPIIVVVSLIFAFSAYWFIFGLVIQRDLG